MTASSGLARATSLEELQAKMGPGDRRGICGGVERMCDLPPGGDSSKVRVGHSGGHVEELSDDLLAELDATWRDTIGTQFGLPTYEAFLTKLR